MMTSTYSPPPSRIIIGYNTQQQQQQQQQNQQAQQQASNGGVVTQVISSSSAPITSSSGQQQKTQTIYRTPSNFIYTNQNYAETNGNGGEVKNHIFTQQQHSKQQLEQQSYGNGIDVGGGGAQQQAEDELLRKNQVRILTYPPPGMDGSSTGGSQSGTTKLIVNGTSIPSTSMSSGGEVKMHELSSTIVYGSGGNGGGATTQILVQNHSDSPAGAQQQQQYSVISPFQLQQQNGGGAADANIEYLVLQDAGENGSALQQQQQMTVQLIEGGAPPVRKTRNLAAKRRRMDNETDEDRARRRARDAETKRARRQRETSEQRARRLSRDSQRMRRTRRIKRLLGPNATLSDLKKSGLTLEDLDAEPPRRRHIRYLKSEKNSKESTPDNDQMLYGSGDSVSTTPRFSTITTSGVGLGPSSSSTAAIVNGGNVGIIQSGNGSHPIILSQAGGPQQHQQQHEIHLNEIIGTPHNSGQQQQYTHSGGGPQTITYEQHSRLQQQHHHHQSQHQQQTSVATSVVPIMATTSAANGAPGGFVTLHVTLPPGVDPQQPQILHLPPSNSLHQHIIVQRPPPLPHQQQHHVQIHGGQHPHQQPQTIIYRTTAAPDEFGIDDYKDYKDFIHIQQPSGASVQIPSSSGTLIPNTHQIQLHHVQPPQHQQQQPLPPHLQQQQQHQLQLHSQQPPPQQQHIIHQQQQQVVVPPPPPPTKRRRQRRGVLVNTNATVASGGVLQSPSVSMTPVVTVTNVPHQRTPRQSAAYRPRAHPGFSGPTSINVGASGSSGDKSRLITSGKFEGLTEDQVLRRRRANAERSRRRRQLETPEQRRERNKRTAERMRARRARMAEERMMTRYSNGGGPPPSTRQIVPLSLDRFEEIFQSVILRCKDSEVVMSRNNRPIIRPKDDDGDLAVSGLQMLHHQGQLMQQQQQQMMSQQQHHQQQMLVDEEDGIDLDAEEEELRQRQMCATPSYIEAEPYDTLPPPSSHQYQQQHDETVASTADNNASPEVTEDYGISSQENAFDSRGDDVDVSTAGATANNTTLSFSGGDEDREDASSSMLNKTDERMDELGESSGFNNTTDDGDAEDCSNSLNVDENTMSPPLSIGDYSNSNAATPITTTILTTAGTSTGGGRSAPTFIDDEEGPKNMVVVVGGEDNEDDDDMDAMVNEMYRTSHRDAVASTIKRDDSVGAGENLADNEECDPSSLLCLARCSGGDTDGERRPTDEAEEDDGGGDGGEPSNSSNIDNNNSGDSTTIVVDEGL